MSLITKDARTGVLYRRWGSPPSNAVLVLVHGLGAHSARWGSLADFFVKRGIFSYAIELKGFGETDSPKGHIDSFSNYTADIRVLCEIAKRENPGKRVFLAGESMGALAAILTVTAEPKLCDGLIAISPAFKNKMRFPPLKVLNIALCAALNPLARFTVPFNSSMCTRDPEYQKVMDSDPRECRFATARLLINILFAQMRAKAEAVKDKIRLPVLFLTAANDVMVDIRTTGEIFERLKSADKTIIQYPQMSHGLSIELGKEKVFSDIFDWIGKRIND